MTLDQLVRALKSSPSDHRARIGAHLEALTLRCAGITLRPEEEGVIEGVVVELARKMQYRHVLTYNDLLGLATWLNAMLR